jgi:catechol 2,3-dioxygenase-like lactoylglutathione lyase family enzyme
VTEVSCLSHISLVSADPHRLARFYCSAFGFTVEKTFSGAVNAIFLRLGQQLIELIGAGLSGQAYPPDISGNNPLFQHFAIVVADIAKAYERLRREPHWAAISREGPQCLPAASGGVTAFKFRDPEHHPLELIEFPPGPVSSTWRADRDGQICLGIDHSAISIADTQRSTAFYESLGLRRSGGSLNQGGEQSRLDGIENAIVEVTSLTIPACAPPHVELLCYRDNLLDGSSRIQSLPATTDIAATQLVFSARDYSQVSELCEQHRSAHISGPVVRDDKVSALLRDPDGHLLRFEAPI